MALTSRFGLHKYGGLLGGAITDDGSAFTARDPDIIDAIMKAFENHTHTGGARLGDPTAAPALTLATTGGSLAANTTYYYRVSFIDQFGLETVASDESFQSTPGTVDRPGAPIVVTEAGGTLLTGVYYYGLTAIAGSNETSLGPVTPVTISDQNTADLTFPATPAGADHISIWRQAPGEIYFSRIATVDLTSDTFTDNGSTLSDPLAYDPTHQPPVTNLTNATSVITVTAPDTGTVSADPSLVKAWRIYRTTVSGSYGSASLVSEVRTTVMEDGTGGLVTTFADNGAIPLTTGAPLSVSQTLTPTTQITAGAIADTEADLPAAAQFRTGTLAVTTSDFKVWAVIGGAWVTVGGGGGAVNSAIQTAAITLTPAGTSNIIDIYIPVETTIDAGKHDLSLVYSVDSNGDEIQVNTEAMYAPNVTIFGSGWAAGDMFEVIIELESSVTAPFAATGAYTNRHMVIVRPDGVVQQTIEGMAGYFYPADRFSFHIVPYYSGAAGTFTANVGMTMINGTAATAEVYPGPVGEAASATGRGEIAVTWTADAAFDTYAVLAYADGVVAAPAAIATGVTGGSHTLTGLADSTVYNIILLGYKTATQLFSSPKTVQATTAAWHVGAFLDHFTGTTGQELDPTNYTANLGNPAGTVVYNSSARAENTGTGGPGIYLHDAGFADKKVSGAFYRNSGGGSPIVLYLEDTVTDGHPSTSVSIDGTTTAPTIDYYDSSGTHTAITMTAAGAGTWANFVGSNASIEFDIHGTTVDAYMGGTQCWTATLPNAVASTCAGFGLFNNGDQIDDFSIQTYP